MSDAEDEAYRQRVGAALRAKDIATLEDVRFGLEELRHDYLPAHVAVACLVLTIQGPGWRRWVLRFAMWAMQKAGHPVVRPEP